jgi:hypothetical protein
MRSLSIFLVTLVVAACSGTTKSTPTAQARSACSTGPEYAPNATFPTEEDSTEYPQCTPRCGQDGSNLFPLAALPSGACDVEGERCSMQIKYVCAENTPPARVDRMRCACSSNAWSCVYVAQGGGICPPKTQPEGGPP